MRRNEQAARRRKYTGQFFRGNRLNFAAALAAAMATGAINLLIAWLLQQMVDTVSGEAGALPLGVLAALTAGVVGLIAVCKAVSWAARPRFLQKAMQQYKSYAFAALTEKSIAAFRAENTAEYLSAFSNDAAAIESGYLESLFTLPAQGLLFFGAFAMMLAYSPAMTLVACGFFLLPLGVSLLAGDRLERAEREISRRNSLLTASLKDALGGFAVVKGFKAEAAVRQQFDARTQSVEQAKCQKRRLETVLGAAGGMAGVTAQLGTFLVGGAMALGGSAITPGVLLIFIDLTAYVIQPIEQLPGLLAARRAALALIDKLADALEQNTREEGGARLSAVNEGITLQKVSFGYQPDRPVLKKLDFRFEAGKSYAVVGASGSGKSTLLRLLMAGHGGYTGDIRFDRTELRCIGSDSLYDLVGLIQQEVFVFNATIRENITMFREFPADEVERAIALSGLSGLVAQRGEAYRCGENGSGLSGGEKQRIAIARCLLRRTPVLLADEATAALDAQTAQQVSSAILSLQGMTRILVTHALDAALLRRFDGILVLHSGRIAESGSFDALMAQKGYFYSLYTVSQK